MKVLKVIGCAAIAAILAQGRADGLHGRLDLYGKGYRFPQRGLHGKAQRC